MNSKKDHTDNMRKPRKASSRDNAKFHYGAKKSLGQHFLNSKTAIDAIVCAADISKGDTILEIGPGKGVLTEKLLAFAKHVIAIEKDGRLIDLLKEKFAKEIHEGRLTLVHEDILEFDPSRHKLKALNYKLVANIPYYITGKILRQFLGSETNPAKMVLLLQKEVADRIIARPVRTGKAGVGKKESILSISVKAYGTPKYVKKVPAGCFTPPPKVDSAIISIENISKKFFRSKMEEERFFDLVKIGFSHKRKLLLSNLSENFNKKELCTVFEKCGIHLNSRAEDLSAEDWRCITTNIT